MRTHIKFGIKIFEIDFVIEIKWYLTFWPLPRAPGGGAINFFYVAHPIHVSNSHTKFGWISSNGLGGDSITDGRMNRRMDGGDNNIPFAECSGWAYSMGLEPASVRPSTLSNMNISETSWPIIVKFYQEYHWGGGLTALGFG